MWILLPKRDLLLCILWKARLEGLRAHSPKNSTAWVWESLSAKLERRGRDARNDDDRKATTGRGKRRSVRVWIWNPWRTFEELKKRTMATLDKRRRGKKKLISETQTEFFPHKEPKEQIHWFTSTCYLYCLLSVRQICLVYNYNFIYCFMKDPRPDGGRGGNKDRNRVNTNDYKKATFMACLVATSTESTSLP